MVKCSWSCSILQRRKVQPKVTVTQPSDSQPGPCSCLPPTVTSWDSYFLAPEPRATELSPTCHLPHRPVIVVRVTPACAPSSTSWGNPSWCPKFHFSHCLLSSYLAVKRPLRHPGWGGKGDQESHDESPVQTTAW